MSDIADPERALVLAYAPAGARMALATLWRLDERLGTIVGTTHEVMIGRIRLAWWREALEALDSAAPPAEPLLQDVARHILPHGIAGTDLAAMEPGWAALVDAADEAGMRAHAAERGGRLFALAARVLDADRTDVARVGEGWALADLAHRLSDPQARSTARRLAAERLAPLPRWPKRLRALGALGMLARDDAAAETRRQGSPARVARMMLHRLTGR